MTQQNTTPGSICAEEYTVKRGDSFYLIAHKLGVPLRDLLAANSGIHPARLMVGDVLCIPREEDDTAIGGTGSANGTAGNGTTGGISSGTNGLTNGVNGSTGNAANGMTGGANGNTSGSTSNSTNGGTSGTTGMNGSAGNTANGTSGSTSNGASGSSGSTGMNGSTGNTANGTSGSTSNGANGTSGSTGNGANSGSSGSNSMNGSTGNTANGTSGTTGNTTNGNTSGSTTNGSTGNGTTTNPTCPTCPTVPGAPSCPLDEQLIVQRGQSVADIQLLNLVSRNTLATANPNVDLDSLRVGQTICVPKENVPCAVPTTYTLGVSETLEAVAVQFNLPVASILRANPCLAPQDFEQGVTVVIPRQS